MWVKGRLRTQMLRIRKFGENQSGYNAALLELLFFVLRGFAGIGFRQGYANAPVYMSGTHCHLIG